jgi:hypothetical protein
MKPVALYTKKGLTFLISNFHRVLNVEFLLGDSGELPKRKNKGMNILFGKLHYEICNFEFVDYAWLHHSGTLFVFAYLLKKYSRKVTVIQIRVAFFCVKLVQSFSSRKLFS